MAASYPVRSFAYGELSARFLSRTDSQFYSQGCRELTNAFALPIGPSEKRTGTIYSATAKTLGKKVKLFPWQHDPNTGIVLEVGDSYIRFYKNGAQIISGTPVEVVSPWVEDDLPDLRFAQAGMEGATKVGYFVHPGHAPRKLTWTSDTSWALSTPTFLGDETFSTTGHYPSHVEFYEDRMIFARTLTKPATFWGSRTANYENFNLRTAYSAAAATMTPIASPGVVNWPSHGLKANTSVMFTTTGALPTGLAVNTPYYVLPAGLTTNAFSLSASIGGAIINFTGATSGTHTIYATPSLDTDGWEKTPRVQANAEILWIVAEDALLFGTSEGPFRVGGKEAILTGSGAWWPTRQASVGCASVQAIMVDDFAAFVGKAGKRIFRFQYEQDVDRYIPDDITFLVESITSEGIIGIAHQREPTTVLWAWTSDGKLTSACYSRTTNSIGWSEHELSGMVESLCVIPTTTEDQVWVSVAREIGGVTYRHIEYFAPRTWELLRDYHGVDAGVVWDGGASKAVTSITNANPAVCNCTANGFSNDDKVMFTDVTGIDVNGEVYTVKNKLTDSFELYTQDGSTPIDFSGESAPAAGGAVRKVTNIVTGLGHLEGETVKTLGDGSVIADEVVTGGQVTLDEFANKIRTGLGFTAITDPMPIAEAQNRLKRVTKVWARFYRTGDAQVSDGEHTPVQITFDGLPTMDDEPVEKTEGLKFLFDGFADYDGSCRIESSQPLPQTILALVYEVVTGS